MSVLYTERRARSRLSISRRRPCQGGGCSLGQNRKFPLLEKADICKPLFLDFPHTHSRELQNLWKTLWKLCKTREIGAWFCPIGCGKLKSAVKTARIVDFPVVFIFPKQELFAPFEASTVLSRAEALKDKKAAGPKVKRLLAPVARISSSGCGWVRGYVRRAKRILRASSRVPA